MPTIDIKKILEEYVATANNPEYKSDFTIINSKFPELKGYDPKLLEEYVATANNEEYKSDFNIINSKFPELFEPEKKKGFQTDLGKAYENTSGGSFPKYQGTPLVGSTPMTKMAPKQPSLPSNVGSGNPELIKLEKELNKKKEPLTNFEKQIKELDSKIAPYTELAKNNKGTLPKDKYQEYSFLIQRRNELANQYKAVYDEYKPLADKYNSIYQKDKKIIDTYNQELETYKKETEAIQKEKFQKEKQKLSKESPIVKIKSYEGALNIVNQRFNQNLELFNQAKQAGDEQAMAQLQPLLQIDSKKAEGLKKGIDAQKNEANFTAPDNAVDGFYIGVYQTIGQLMQGPKFLDEGIKRLAYQTTTGKSSKDLDKYFENRGTISDKIAAAGKIVSDFASERSDEMKVNRAYGGSATEALLNQDYSNAASFIFKDFLQNTPSSLSYINPATATLMTVGAVGEEMSQAERDGRTKDYNVILAGAIKGGLEIVTERWLGAGKAGIKLVNKLGREGAEQAIRNTAEQLVKKSLGRKLVEMQGEEVVGETINLIGSNLTDIYLNGRTDITPTTGISDNALNAVFGSVVQGGPATTLNHYIDKAKYNKAQAMREEAASLTDQAMDQPNEVAAQALEEKAAEIQAQADEIEKKESELAINASTETVDAIMEKEAQIDELSAAIEVATPETAPILEEKLNALEEERVALVEQATLEANEAIKALESVKEPQLEIDTPTLNLSVKENPFKESLRKLGYNDSDIDNMTMEQMQEIVINKTEAPIVESSAKVDSIKENAKQERIAELQKQLEDETITTKEENVQPMLEGVQTNRDENQAGETSPELRPIQTQEEEVVQEAPAKEEVKPKPLQDKKSSEKIKVFRGTGDNVKSTENKDLLWVAEDKRVAENYAGKEGSVEEIEIEKPKNPYQMNESLTYVKGSDIAFLLREERDKLYQEGKINDNQYEYISDYISEFEKKAGENPELQTTKINKEGNSKLFVDILSSMGFDGIIMKESYYSKSPFKATKTGEESITYAVFKKSPQSTTKAVEELLTNKQQKTTTKEEVKAQESLVEETPALTGEQVKNKLQEIEKEPVKINITQDENGNMEQTSQEVIDNIKQELDKTGLPYSNVVSNEKGSTYFVVTKDGQQHEILKVLQSGGKLVPTNLTKAKWINHLIKTEKDSVVKAVEELLTNKQQEDAVKTGKKSKSNISEYQGTAEQQQGKQEDRTNKEEPISTSQEEAGNRSGSKQSRESKTQEVSRGKGFQKVVLDEGNGIIINDLYNEWNNIKNDKDLSKWENKVKETKFGTYGTIGLIETLNKFDINLNDVTKRTFYNDIESALNIPINQRTYSPNKITEIKSNEEVALNPDEEVITEEIKITKNEAKRAKSASPKRTRKSKDVAKVIENQAKDVEDSGDVEGARDIIESVETAEAAILNNTPVLNNFKDKYGVDEVELANEFNLMDKKNADLKIAYEVISGNKFEGNINIFTKDFLEAISANGIKLKNKVSFEIEEGVNNEILVLPLPIKSKGKSGIDSLETIVLKDALRPVMQSVYFEDNNLIATNGHILIVLPQKQTDSEIKDVLADKYFKSLKKVIPTYTKKQAIEYIDKNTEGGLKGKIFDAKTGEFVDGIYPKYKAVIPQNFDNETQPESIDNLISIANGGVFLAKNNTSDIFAINLGDKGSQYTYQPQLFLNILQAMQSNGAKKVILKSSEKAGRPLVLESDNGIIGLIMPIQVKEESLVSQGFNIIESKESITDSIITKLENLKADTKGKMNAFGIIPAIWNAGVDTIILAVKAGKSISEAIQEGINYFKENGAKFDEAEVTDFFNKLLSKKKEEPKVEQETPKEEPKKEKVEEPKSKTSKFYKTVFNNKSLEDANKVLTEDDFSYEVKSTKESLKKAKEYVDRVGIEDAYDNFMRNKTNELQPDEEVALASLLTVIVNMGVQESINQNNEESREFFYDNYRALMLHAQNKFTKLGQAVNAIKLFLDSMSSPELAEYKLRKTNQESNEEIKKKSSVKTNASTRVNSGKKTVNEGVKTAAEEVAQELNNELYGVITKGKKGLTESQKKNVKDFFNKLKIDTKNAAFSTIIPIPPKLYNDFVEAVGNLVVEGVSLSVAMTQISTEFIKNKIGSPDELAQARKILSEEVNGLKEKKPLTEAQKQRNAAREELRKATAEYKELEKLAKELEKERERVEKLRKEEAKKQSERIDKATNELLAAERKEAEKNAKELEKKIKELSKEISQGKALQDQVEDIINEYLKMGAMDNTANQALIDLVKERLGITDEKQAVDVATKIAKSVVTNIREKLSKKWDADIKRQRKKETKEEKVKDPHKEVNEFVKGVALGSMDAEQFIELFGAKYGLETLTEQDFSKVRELAAKVRDAETKHRKAKALNDMVQYINSKAPVTLSQLFDELWYFKVLSSAPLFFLGTGDTNLTYNATQVANIIFELPIQEIITTILRNKENLGKGKGFIEKSKLKAATFAVNVAAGYGKSIIQRNTLKNRDINIRTFLNVLKEQGLLNESINYFKEVMTEGSGAFKEFESPFKANAKTEFEIRRWFKLAKNGDLAAKNKIVAALYDAGNFGADLLNTSVNLVPRSLAAGDLFFSPIVKNAYLPALVREYLVKNTDLRGAALNAEINRMLLNTDIELENAKQKALENRMKFDIEVKPKMIGDKMVYEIYDKGDVVKQTISEYVKGLKLTRRKVLQFDTKEEANEYARRVVAPSGSMYQMDITDYLNVKVPVQALQAANRLAGQVTLGGTPPGRTGLVLKKINDTVKGLEKFSENIEGLSLYIDNWNKLAKYPSLVLTKALAVFVRSMSRLFAFMRVNAMLGRNFSNYLTPIGLLRAGMAGIGKSAFLVEYTPDQMPTEVERDKMIAQAITGAVVAYMGVVSVLALLSLVNSNDEEEDEERKNKNVPPQSKEDKRKSRINFAFNNLQVGMVTGSFKDVLTKDEETFYVQSGRIKEYSILDKFDKNGNPVWKSIKGDPKYATAIMAATYMWDRIINIDDEPIKSFGKSSLSILKMFQDMGIGQGLPKLIDANSFEQVFKQLSQTIVFDNVEITKISLIEKLAQYYDGKKRLNPHWIDYTYESGNMQGTADYLLNEFTPVYSLGDAVRQPVVYGALGEELFRVPAQEQGYFSAAIAYLNSDKNKEQKDMYRWLASNGYDKMFYANVTDLKDAEGNEIKLSMYEKNKLGMLAAKASYLELKKKKADLEVIRQTGGTKAFRTEVEKIFRSNFNDVVQLVKKEMAPDAVQYEREKNDIEFNNKVEKLKADNEGLFELIDGIKSEISNAEVKLVPFEEMDTFGTALKEAKSSDKWNMITSNLNMLKGKYDKVALEQYLIYLEDLGYLQPELGKDAYNYMMGEKPE